jgi:hypothetical protein
MKGSNIELYCEHGKINGDPGDTITTGAGNDVIYAHNGASDHISCAAGNGTTVYADRGDIVERCMRVSYGSPSKDVHRAARKLGKKSHHRRHKGSVSR